MNRTHKIALVIASNVIAFAFGAMHSRSTVVVQAPATPVTHTINGLVLSEDQFQTQLAAQNAANTKMEQDYAVTLAQEKDHYDSQVDAFVVALAKKAQKDHGLWIASPVKHNTSL